VNYSPGRRIAVRYSARVAWPGARITTETIAALERRNGHGLSVWRWPDDPALPGIRAATDPARVADLLDGPAELTRRSYWPGRRAVIEARGPGRTLFIKVVRPAETERIRHVHETLAAGLPVARLATASQDLGLVVLESLPGRTISACLSDPHEAPPAPCELLELLERLGDLDVGGTPGRTTAAKIARHVRLLATVLPEEADALHRFAERYGNERAQPLTTVHGDLHEEQVLSRGGRISGLVDVDGAGPGQLVDDLALIVARVRARAEFGPTGSERARAYEQRLTETFAGAVDPHELARRAAGALLGRATAPFRVQNTDWERASKARIRAAEAALARVV
jgi:aminoglycoside phosphotransferase